ncbi:hypothetical protein [Gimesia sp.]|uniref:hypothetical protein n=1 Tax=Gimesia sp. TaxID=2024833 RepID=UPI000C607F43|nr:hypothetical protein [Gimesia sp.]MAX40314.1 hypothetical protein [Gimesia sp.]HAH47202.1 hypothetical protein [Planctomycetaceae bacterium]HBL42520.1 hypothetical protein [Planctomycetaceae bacterium]|tara:strand:+ start:11539 stop:12165 length:627 start_codon:yes stop_codon:yes gene_type:complete
MIEIDPIDEPDFSIDRPEFNPLSVTIIVPLVLIMLMLTYVAYVVYDLKLQAVPNPKELFKSIDQEPSELFKAIDRMAFGLFLLSEVGQIFLCGYSGLQLNRFLHQHPAMNNYEILERLKPLVRTNMYFVPVGLLFIGVALVTGIFCLYQHDLLEKAVVLCLWFVSTGVAIRCSVIENKVRAMESTEPVLKAEYESVCQSWLQRMFPDF